MTMRPLPHPLRRVAVPTVVAALALGACGDDAELRADPAPAATTAAPTPEPTPEAEATPEPARRAAAGTRLRAIGSQFGRIVGDGPGLAVYMFDKERRGRSECYGACAKAWPPVPAKGRPVAGKGIDPELLGTTRRRNGKRQLTYRGQPLYYYEHDRPGLVLCHDVFEFGGTWLVIRPSGRAVE
jgi:predicted lipoprotein with Yx(FWY)xxD motif